MRTVAAARHTRPGHDRTAQRRYRLTRSPLPNNYSFIVIIIIVKFMMHRFHHELEEAGTHKSAKIHAGENQANAETGKPGVATIACAARHYSTENPAWLTYSAAITLRSV